MNKVVFECSIFLFSPLDYQKSVVGGGVDSEKQAPLENAKICKICIVIILKCTNGLQID